MKVEYTNMPKGYSRLNFTLRYYFNTMRTWYLFHIKYPWVKYNGFVRVMAHTSFAKRSISIGHNVQFGLYCNISADTQFGNNILLAGRVCIVGKNDHAFDVPGQLIWHGCRVNDQYTIIEDDVWIGHNATVIAGVTIGKGSVVTAGAVVTKNVPPCEVWGGVPARKIKDRFDSISEKEKHLDFLNSNHKGNKNE